MRPSAIRALPLLFCALLTGVLPAAEQTAEKAADPVLPLTVFKNLQAGKKQTVVTFGTSLTERGPWVALLQPWFEARYPHLVKVVNSGGSGQNSKWGVENVKAKVVDLAPDLVFIEFGINDAHTRFKLSVEETKGNLDTIVKAIQTRNPQVSLVLQTMNAVLDVPPKGVALTSRPQLAAYYGNYVSYAAEHHLALIDNYPQWLKLTQDDPKTFLGYAADGLHPNKDGIMAVTWPNIEKLLTAADTAARK